MNHIISAILIHICAPISISVARQFPHEHVSNKGINIENIAVILAISAKLIGEDHVLKIREIIADIIILLFSAAVVRRFYSYRDGMIGRGKPFPFRLIISICIHFDEVSPRQRISGYILRFHLSDIKPTGIHLHLVAELIAPLILTIENHIHCAAPWNIGHLKTTANLESEQISHQSLITIIIDQSPLLCLGRGIKHILFLVKLDTPWFLGESARIVASFPHACSCIRINFSVVDNNHIAGDIMLLIIRLGCIYRVYAHRRERRKGEISGVRSFPLGAIKFKFGDIAAGIRSAYEAHIPETLRAIHISITHLADHPLLSDHIYRHSVKEIITVGTLDHPQLHTLRAMPIIARRPSNTGDYMRGSQIETNPCVRTFVGGKIGVQFSIKRTSLDILDHPVMFIIKSIDSADWSA